MIAIIIFLELCNHHFSRISKCVSKHIDVIRHIFQKFFFCDAADSCIFIVHRHICDIVQFTKDANLRELGDTCKENKTQFCLTIFQRTKEVAHDIAQHIQLLFLVSHIQHRRIIFIDEHNHLFSALLISSIDEVDESVICPDTWFIYTPFLLLIFQDIAQIQFQLLWFHVLATAHVKMEDRVFRPLLF